MVSRAGAEAAVSQLFAFADDVPDGPYADNHRRRKERDAAHMQQFRGDRAPTGHRGPQRGAGPGPDPGPAERQPPSVQGARALCHGREAPPWRGET